MRFSFSFFALQTVGIVGGTAYGVAKKAKRVAVRIFDCAGNGTWGGNLAALAWVALDRTTSVLAPLILAPLECAGDDVAHRK